MLPRVTIERPSSLQLAITIQKYILATMVLGFLEVSFLGIDLLIWNITGLRSPVVAYTGKTCRLK